MCLKINERPQNARACSKMLARHNLATRTALHASYSSWCLMSCFEPLSNEAFGKELTRKGFENVKGRDGNKRKGIVILT